MTQLPSPHGMQKSTRCCLEACRLKNPATCRDSIDPFSLFAFQSKLSFPHKGAVVPHDQMNPHISIPRQHGGTASYGVATPAGRSDGLRMPRFFKRCVLCHLGGERAFEREDGARRLEQWRLHPFCNVELKSEDHMSKVADGFAVRLSLKAI